MVLGFLGVRVSGWGSGCSGCSAGERRGGGGVLGGWGAGGEEEGVWGLGTKKKKKREGKNSSTNFFFRDTKIEERSSHVPKEGALCPPLTRPGQHVGHTRRPMWWVTSRLLHGWRSSNDDATAFAAAHPNMAPQRSLHACSARLLINGTSSRARALAKCLKNARVSLDHRPPTSTAGTCPLAKS